MILAMVKGPQEIDEYAEENPATVFRRVVGSRESRAQDLRSALRNRDHGGPKHAVVNQVAFLQNRYDMVRCDRRIGGCHRHH